MAGFAVDIGDEGTAYAQGVTMPSATSASVAAEGLSMIGKGIFGVLDSMDAAKRAAQPTESAINREAVANFSKAIQATKGETPFKKRLSILSAITNLNNAGFEVDEGLARMVKIQTGIDVDYLNVDPNQEALNKTMQKVQENRGYVPIARAKLISAGIENPTDEQIFNQINLDIQADETAALYLATAKNITRQDYYDTYLPSARKALESVRALAIEGLKVEQGGGNISPDNVTRLRSQLEIVKAQFTKPPLIEEQDWQAVQSQVDTLESLIKTLESYDADVLAATTAETLEPITRVLLKQAKELAKTDPVLAAALLSDKVDWSPYVASKYPEVLESIDILSAKDTVYTDLFAPVPALTPPAGTTPEGTPPAITTQELHDVEEITKAEDRDDLQRRHAITFAAHQRIGIMTPTMMNQPEHRDNFLAGIGQATVNIINSSGFYSQDIMNQVFNDDTYSKLALIRNLDPEKAELASQRLIQALEHQFTARQTSMSGSMQSSYFKVTGLGEIEYDLESRVDSGQIRMDRSVAPLLKTAANRHYNGDVTALIADRGRKFAFTPEYNRIEDLGFKFSAAFQDYRKVKKASDGQKYYITQMKKLGVPTEVIEATLIKPIEITESPETLGTQQNPHRIEWSDETDTDELMFATLEDGEYFVGPDGSVYVKGAD